MDSRISLEEIQIGNRNLVELFSGGVVNAVSGLSEMAGREIGVAGMGFKKVMVQNIPDLFGGPETPIVAVYLEMLGETNGHMIVVYQPKVAFELIDLLLGQPTGSTTELNEMEMSTLGEVGNIMGSFFLNYISDTTGIRFQPSPPAVMMDMAGAILDAAIASVLKHCEHTYVMETTFGTNDRQVAGTFLVIPEPRLEAL